MSIETYSVFVWLLVSLLVHRPAVYIPCTYVHACIYIEGVLIWSFPSWSQVSALTEKKAQQKGSLNARKCTYPPLDEHRYGKQPPFADPFPNRKQPSIPYRLDHVVVNVLHGRVPQQTKYDGIRMILIPIIMEYHYNGRRRILKPMSGFNVIPWYSWNQ